MFRRPISWIVIITFAFSVIGPYKPAHADVLGLPTPGSMVNLSPAFEPTLIKGITVHKDNPFLFDFIVDTGHSGLQGDALKQEGDRLVKYFFACLTVPEKDLWVNLSPYEKDRMVPQALGQTALGRDLLAQDYILKQLTASLIYPEKNLGKEFWSRVYAKAQEEYGTTQIPVNTFNKVWILADKASVYESGQTAFVLDGHLKVMLEEDYLALQKHETTVESTVIASEAKQSHTIASQIIRQIVLPELEKEVNTGKNFAPLRQIFNSLILANWYKNNLKEALVTQVYADKSTVKGIQRVIASGAKQSQQDLSPEKIYQQYLQAYKKGVFNYIKEVDAPNGVSVPRKYFSGGFGETQSAAQPAIYTRATINSAQAAKLDSTQTGSLERFTVALFLNNPVPSIPTNAAMTTQEEALVKARVEAANDFLSNHPIRWRQRPDENSSWRAAKHIYLIDRYPDAREIRIVHTNGNETTLAIPDNLLEGDPDVLANEVTNFIKNYYTSRENINFETLSSFKDFETLGKIIEAAEPREMSAEAQVLSEWNSENFLIRCAIIALIVGGIVLGIGWYKYQQAVLNQAPENLKITPINTNSVPTIKTNTSWPVPAYEKSVETVKIDSNSTDDAAMTATLNQSSATSGNSIQQMSKFYLEILQNLKNDRSVPRTFLNINAWTAKSLLRALTGSVLVQQYKEDTYPTALNTIKEGVYFTKLGPLFVVRLSREQKFKYQNAIEFSDDKDLFAIRRGASLSVVNSTRLRLYYLKAGMSYIRFEDLNSLANAAMTAQKEALAKARLEVANEFLSKNPIRMKYGQYTFSLDNYLGAEEVHFISRNDNTATIAVPEDLAAGDPTVLVADILSLIQNSYTVLTSFDEYKAALLPKIEAVKEERRKRLDSVLIIVDRTIVKHSMANSIEKSQFQHVGVSVVDSIQDAQRLLAERSYGAVVATNFVINQGGQWGNSEDTVVGLVDSFSKMKSKPLLIVYKTQPTLDQISSMEVRRLFPGVEILTKERGTDDSLLIQTLEKHFDAAMKAGRSEQEGMGPLGPNKKKKSIIGQEVLLSQGGNMVHMVGLASTIPLAKAHIVIPTKTDVVTAEQVDLMVERQSQGVYIIKPVQLQGPVKVFDYVRQFNSEDSVYFTFGLKPDREMVINNGKKGLPIKIEIAGKEFSIGAEQKQTFDPTQDDIIISYGDKGKIVLSYKVNHLYIAQPMAIGPNDAIQFFGSNDGKDGLVQLSGRHRDSIGIMDMSDGRIEVYYEPLKANAAMTTTQRLPWETDEFLKLKDETGVEFVGNTEEVKKLLADVKRVGQSKSNAPILIDGASGTGKELVWKLLHQLSQRKNALTTIRINVSDLNDQAKRGTLGAYLYGTKDSPGILKFATNSTVILDDIDAANPEVQGALLRLLEDPMVHYADGAGWFFLENTQFIATKNKPFPSADKFRQDLIWRFERPINIRPLSWRIEDQPLLFEYYSWKKSRAEDIPWKPLSLAAGMLLASSNFAKDGQVRLIKSMVDQVYRMDSDQPFVTASNLMATTGGHDFNDQKNAAQRNIFIRDVNGVDIGGFQHNKYLDDVHGNRPYFPLPENNPWIMQLRKEMVPQEEAERQMVQFNQWFANARNRNRIMKKVQDVKFQLVGNLPNGEYAVDVSFMMDTGEKIKKRIETSLQGQGSSLWVAVCTIVPYLNILYSDALTAIFHVDNHELYRFHYYWEKFIKAEILTENWKDKEIDFEPLRNSWVQAIKDKEFVRRLQAVLSTDSFTGPLHLLTNEEFNDYLAGHAANTISYIVRVGFRPSATFVPGGSNQDSSYYAQDLIQALSSKSLREIFEHSTGFKKADIQLGEVDQRERILSILIELYRRAGLLEDIAYENKMPAVNDRVQTGTGFGVVESLVDPGFANVAIKGKIHRYPVNDLLVLKDTAMTASKEEIQEAKTYLALLDQVEKEKDYTETVQSFLNRLSTKFDLEALLLSNRKITGFFETRGKDKGTKEVEKYGKTDFSGFLYDNDGDVWLVSSPSKEQGRDWFGQKLCMVWSSETTRSSGGGDDYSLEGAIIGGISDGVVGAAVGFGLGSLFEDDEEVVVRRKMYIDTNWMTKSDFIGQFANKHIIGYLSREDLQEIANATEQPSSNNAMTVAEIKKDGDYIIGGYQAHVYFDDGKRYISWEDGEHHYAEGILYTNKEAKQKTIEGPFEKHIPNEVVDAAMTAVGAHNVGGRDITDSEILILVSMLIGDMSKLWEYAPGHISISRFLDIKLERDNISKINAILSEIRGYQFKWEPKKIEGRTEIIQGHQLKRTESSIDYEAETLTVNIGINDHEKLRDLLQQLEDIKKEIDPIGVARQTAADYQSARTGLKSLLDPKIFEELVQKSKKSSERLHDWDDNIPSIDQWTYSILRSKKRPNYVASPTDVIELKAFVLLGLLNRRGNYTVWYSLPNWVLQLNETQRQKLLALPSLQIKLRNSSINEADIAKIEVEIKQFKQEEGIKEESKAMTALGIYEHNVASARAPGGIDLNSANMAMTVTKDANGGVEVSFDPALIARIRQEGVHSAIPVIINVSSMSSAELRPLLNLPQ